MATRLSSAVSRTPALDDRLDPLDPADLPSPASVDRWEWLQRLRAGTFPLEPWLAAIEAGGMPPESDLIAVLADRLDGAATVRLLRWWLAQPLRDPAFPQAITGHRDPVVATALRQALGDHADTEVQAALLPLLGHQRQSLDFDLLQRRALEPAPRQQRCAALEGLGLGLSVWPLGPLRTTLIQLATDLDPALAAAAVDSLARLPDGRSGLLAVRSRSLEPAVAERLERRLRSLPIRPLLLLVHGRAQGEIPAELLRLAAELRERRGAPVLVRALTDPQPAELPTLEHPLGLVPLLLLPGEHVRRDLPRLRLELRPSRGLKVLPFLGSWPVWQRALAAELDRQVADWPSPPASPALLLHHPIASPLGCRYLRLLAAITGATPLEAAYGSDQIEASLLGHQGAVLPLALAANRLTEALTPRFGEAAAPLLSRPALRQVVLEQLEALP
jgi:sirohydrochlorin ferrochelatase